ncbi:hypothetical protein KQI63_05785 [bacterium]|nr:hypothetical protein [bacterium]
MNFRPFDPFADAIRTGANLRLQLALANQDEEKKKRSKREQALSVMANREADTNLGSIEEMMANPNLSEADRKALRYLKDVGIGTNPETGMQFTTDAGDRGLDRARRMLAEGTTRARSNLESGQLEKKGLETNYKQLLDSAGQPGVDDEQIVSLVTELNKIGSRLGRPELPTDPAFYKDPVGVRQLAAEARAEARYDEREQNRIKAKLEKDEKSADDDRREKAIDRIDNQLGGPSEPNSLESRLNNLMKKQGKTTLSLQEQRQLDWLSDQVSNLRENKDTILAGGDIPELNFATMPNTQPPKKPSKTGFMRGIKEADVVDYVRKLVAWWDGIPGSVIEAEIQELGADPDKIKEMMRDKQTASK